LSRGLINWFKFFISIQPRSKQSARKRTIFNDFSLTRSNVTKSNVMIYGDLEVGREKLSSFIGYTGNGENSPNVQQSNDLNIKVKYHIIILICSTIIKLNKKLQGTPFSHNIILFYCRTQHPVEMCTKPTYNMNWRIKSCHFQKHSNCQRNYVKITR